MLQGWVVVIIALAYIGFLFLVASYGDRRHELVRGSRARLLIYPLSLAIYCTSWTFFGSVGLASRAGFDFLAIYIGPVLVVGFAYPLIIRIVRLAKGQNITSIADFIAARYGKSQTVAATVALIAIVGMIPYIALQLKAVSSSVGTILAAGSIGSVAAPPLVGDIALFVALLMAAFAVLFGTRHIDATEHQDGLMLAIATESTIKLIAFLAVGIFVTFVMFHDPLTLLARALQQPQTAAVLTRAPPLMAFCAMTMLSLFAILLLPRQFHVAVVENHSEVEIRRAAWLFPAYLVLINLFVMPIAMAGLLTFPAGGVDSDMFVLALPLKAHSELLTLIAFVGGLSAATAMVIVESVALAIMVSNDIVMPLILKRRAARAGEPSDAGAQLLTVRRIAIFAILLLAYIYYRSAGEAQLASIGLLSFAAIAQLTPAFFGGLVWRRGTARGAIAGMTAGILVWAYTLLLPSISDAGILDQHILTDGPFGLAWLRPQALFGLDLAPLVHGVLLSLVANIALYVGFSFSRRPTAIERVQGDVFVPSSLAPIAPSFRLRRASVTIEELTATVARYLGEERTRKSFASFAASRRIGLEPQAEADFQLLQYGEYLLGLGDRRGVVAAGAVAVAAQAHRFDQGGAQAARRCQRGDPLQSRDPADGARPRPPRHRRVRPRAGAALLEPPVRRTARPAARPDADRHPARRNSPPYRAAGRARRQGPRRPGRRAHRQIHLGRRAVPRALRRARAGDRSARRPHARRRGGDDLHRHHAERGGRGGARARQRDLGAPRARAHRRADAAQRRTRTRQGRSRRRQRLEDALHRRRQPRHFAAAQRRAALRDQPDRAPARRRGRRSGAEYRRLARGGGRDIRGAVGYFAARHRRDEAGTQRFPHRRIAAAAGSRIYADGAGEGSRPGLHALRAGGALRPAPAATAVAEPGLERDQIYPRRYACWWAAGAAARGCASTSTIPASAFRTPSGARCSRNFTVSTRARGSRAAWA